MLSGSSSIIMMTGSLAGSLSHSAPPCARASGTKRAMRLASAGWPGSRSSEEALSKVIAFMMAPSS